MYSGFNSKSIIIGVKRLRNDHFIPGIQASQKTKEDGFRATGRNDNLLMINGYSFGSIILYQFTSVTFITCAMAVLKYFKSGMPDSFQCGWWCFYIRLSDIQMVYMGSSFFCSFCKWYQFTYGGSRHFHSAMGDSRHIFSLC